MTDSMKLVEMQTTANMDFERQRHLANWLIKSRPHMAPLQNDTNPITAATTNGTSNAHMSHANNTNTATTVATVTVAAAAAVKPHNSNQRNVCLSNSNLNCSSQISHLARVGAGSKCIYLTPINGNMGALLSATKSTTNVTSTSTHTGPPPPLTGQSMHPHSHSHPHSHPHSHAHHRNHHGLSHLAEGRRAKLRRFNSHDTNSNMFSAADFENARLARRNEIELRQRLQKRLRNGFIGNSNANGGSGCGTGNGTGAGAGINNNSGNGFGTNFGGGGGGTGGNGGGIGLLGSTNYGLMNNSCNINADYTTGGSNESQTGPLSVEEFLERYSLPRVAKIFYKSKSNHVTLQSSSSNGSSTVTSSTSSTSAGGNGQTIQSSSSIITPNTMDSHIVVVSSNSNTGTSSSTSSATASVPTSTSTSANPSRNNGCKTIDEHSTNTKITNGSEQGELFLLYRLIRQRHIYHGHSAKSTVANRKKGVLIPQEFPGYFSLLNDKGLPMATQYTSLIQLVREGVFKFISVENMTAFIEAETNTNPEYSSNDGCLNIYSFNSSNMISTNNRSQYVKTTANGGQVYKLLDVFNHGKQQRGVLGLTTSSGSLSASKQSNNGHGREKEKGYYAILLNEQKQVLYVSMTTKGKFYEIERGIPQVLQRYLNRTSPREINPDCVHRIAALINPHKELPITLKYISGPNDCAHLIPENLCVTRITTENIIIACPIEDLEMQTTSLHLRKIQLNQEMSLIHSTLGFENDQRMIANTNVQNILKFCQFNYEQFLKIVEPKLLKNFEKASSGKNRKSTDGLKILKPLHLPFTFLRREKTSASITHSAHEKEDSIIFLSKLDLANLENKNHNYTENNNIQNNNNNQQNHSTNRLTDKINVFQSTKKKWFRRQESHNNKNTLNNSLEQQQDGSGGGGDDQAKRMSMERYTDMSKLLQERFREKLQNSVDVDHVRDAEHAGEYCMGNRSEARKISLRNGMSGGNVGTLQKSRSLQDIELSTGHERKVGHAMNASTTTKAAEVATTANDTISEAGTDIEDIENREPLPYYQQQQQSFITQKLYNEFHVRTKQYSKSSSNLHQLKNFSLPQKLQIGDNSKRSSLMAQNNSNNKQLNRGGAGIISKEKRLDFNIGEPVTGRRALANGGGLNLLTFSQTTSLSSTLTPNSLMMVEDDLPYASVRDSLIFSNNNNNDKAKDNNCSIGTIEPLPMIAYSNEDIYTEICPQQILREGERDNSNRLIHTIHSTPISNDDDYNNDIYYNDDAHHNHNNHNDNNVNDNNDNNDNNDDDDYGDYAFLAYPITTNGQLPMKLMTNTNNNNNSKSLATTITTSNASTGLGNAISRVQIGSGSLNNSPIIKYHNNSEAAYDHIKDHGKENNDKHKKRNGLKKQQQQHQQQQQQCEPQRSPHITKVDVLTYDIVNNHNNSNSNSNNININRQTTTTTTTKTTINVLNNSSNNDGRNSISSSSNNNNESGGIDNIYNTLK